MPIYQCITPAGTVPDAVRPQIAKEITRLHVEATNAPPSFVHVIILDAPPSFVHVIILDVPLTSAPRQADPARWSAT
jgi:phenylpyruvate tautomerase PptA (4-oxalocrotonate tautomerase family)